jgi:hypothetical protein
MLTTALSRTASKWPDVDHGPTPWMVWGEGGLTVRYMFALPLALTVGIAVAMGQALGRTAHLYATTATDAAQSQATGVRAIAPAGALLNSGDHGRTHGNA